jgi:hypothetical protein
VKASTWRLKTGTFRLRETTPTENPCPPDWRLGTRLTALSCKNFVANLLLEKPRIEERRGPVRRNTDIRIGTWAVRSLYKTGALKALIMQLEKYKMCITAVQETRWFGSGIHSLKKHSILYSGKKRENHAFWGLPL